MWFQAKTFHTVLALREGVFGTDIWVDPLENDITGVDFYVSVKLKWTSFTFFMTNPYKKNHVSFGNALPLRKLNGLTSSFMLTNGIFTKMYYG